jgi:serine/threonine protein kinase
MTECEATEKDDLQESTEALAALRIQIPPSQVTSSCKYKLTELVQERKGHSCEVYRGVWTAKHTYYIKHNSPVIIKRVFHHDTANSEIHILQKLMHKTNPLQDFFVKLVHVACYPGMINDLILEDGGDDVFMHFAHHYPFRDYSDEAFTIRVKHLSYVMSHVVECVLKLHLLGFVHNDIKPENAVIDNTPSQRVRLIDFSTCTRNAYVSNYDIHFMNGDQVGSEFFIHPALVWERPILLFHNDWWAVGQFAWTLYTNLELYNPSRTTVYERNRILDSFLHGDTWTLEPTLPPSLRDHPSFPLFASFVTSMCCETQCPSSPSMLLLQHPFLCYWKT